MLLRLHNPWNSKVLNIKLGSMTTLPKTFPIHVVRQVSSEEFIEHWSHRYPLKKEPIYQENIGQPLTPERIWALFEWKNNGPIAKQKRNSILKNYINTTPVVPHAEDRDGLVRFIQEPGGAIWRIFWLHCYNQNQYPIFDQHVYRAMHHQRCLSLETSAGMRYDPFHAPG